MRFAYGVVSGANLRWLGLTTKDSNALEAKVLVRSATSFEDLFKRRLTYHFW